VSSNAVAALAEAVAAAGGPTAELAALCAAVAVANDGAVEAEWRQVFPADRRSLAGAAAAADLAAATSAEPSWRSAARPCVYAAAQLGTPTLQGLLSAGRVAGRLAAGDAPTGAGVGDPLADVLRDVAAATDALRTLDPGRGPAVLPDRPVDPYAVPPAETAPVASAQQGAPVPPSAEAEPPRTLEELLGELDELVGLDEVKAEVHAQAQLLRVAGLRRDAGLRSADITRHLVFVGNPGTGKTTVARLVAEIYRATGVLPTGHLVEVDRSELVAGYVGQTAIKTAQVIDSAVGGVLFIDEAYALADDDFGSEAVETLVKGMEDHREDLVVIVAGYPAPMEQFVSVNPGLRSRFRKTITFADYSIDELVAIFDSMATKADYSPTEACRTRLRELAAVEERNEGFGNARWVRGRLETAMVNAAWRLRDVEQPTVEQLRHLEPDDLTDTVHPAPDTEPARASHHGAGVREATDSPGVDADAAPDADVPADVPAGEPGTTPERT
jgi:adenylate kinase family enzyme